MKAAKPAPEHAADDDAAEATEPIITPPPGAYAASESGAAYDSATGPQPAAHPTAENVGAARAEEHAAPAPSSRIGLKLWIVAGLVALIAAAAIMSGV